MIKLTKINSKVKTKSFQDTEGNGIYPSLEELMNMRKYVKYLQNNRLRKTHSYQSGDLKSVFKGRGIEMEEIRQYSFGDDVRDIDWRVTARKELPYTKIYAEERDREVYVWLDLSSLMLFGSYKELKSVTAAKTASLLGWLALNKGYRFGCLLFDGNKFLLYKPKNDRAYLAALLKMIANVAKTSSEDPKNNKESRIKALQMLSADIKNRADVFIISSFSGWNDEYDSLLIDIARRADLTLINIFDHLEEKAPAAGQYFAQNGNDRLVFDTSDKKYRKKYNDYFASKRKKREDFCNKFGCKIMNFSADMSVVGNLKIL